MLKYLGRDPGNQSERTRGIVFERYLPIQGKNVHTRLELGMNSARGDFRAAPTPRESRTARRLIRHMLGLDQPLEKFYRALKKEPAMTPVLTGRLGTRIPRLPDLWETLCWAILGQQINLTFAYRLRNRLIRAANPRAGDSADPNHANEAPPRNIRPFPTPTQVLAVSPAVLKRRQFSGAKIKYLRELALAFQGGLAGDLPGAGEVQSEDDARVFRETLLAVKGLGPWSVDYALMRCGGYLDALPVGDSGLRAALKKTFSLNDAPDIRAQEKLMEPFRPYRSLATYYLWKSLETQ